MDLKALNVHIENLLPGAVIMGVAIGHWGMPPIYDTFVLALLFLAISYCVGVASAVLSRWILDFFSERSGLRALFLGRLVHIDRNTLKKKYRDYDELYEGDLKRTKSKCKLFRGWLRDWLAEWNACYRASIRTVMASENAVGKQELSRRREQGRLVRNLFFPAIATAVGAGLQPPWHVWAPVGAALVVAILYAYSELNNMAEAVDILDAKRSGGPPLQPAHLKAQILEMTGGGIETDMIAAYVTSEWPSH